MTAPQSRRPAHTSASYSGSGLNTRASGSKRRPQEPLVPHPVPRGQLTQRSQTLDPHTPHRKPGLN